MFQLKRIFIIAPFIITFFIPAGTHAANAGATALPYEYGRVVIANHSQSAGLAPVVFDHWRHRSKFTCRLCHVDIGFAMKAGATNITASTNKQGFYCGACHNGKRNYKGKAIFASCSGAAKSAACERCHSLKKPTANERDFKAFAAKMPKKTYGNGIDWEAAESKGLIKPIDTLEGVSMQRPRLKPQKDFSIEAKVQGVSDVVFSHKKHAVWNGCELCHPDIFPIIKGTVKYTMADIKKGDYCGVCHVKIAFPLDECQRCHSKVKT